MSNYKSNLKFLFFWAVFVAALFILAILLYGNDPDQIDNNVNLNGALVSSNPKSAGLLDFSINSGNLAARTVLPQFLKDLKSKSDSGDLKASCKLASELQKCVDMSNRLSVLSASPISTKAALTGVESLLGSLARCEGAAALNTGEIVSYWRKAAEAGSYEAKRYYVLGRPFRSDDVISSANELIKYRDVAEKYAIELAMSGDIYAMLALADANDPSNGKARSLLSQVIIEKDPVFSLFIYDKVYSVLGKSGTPPEVLKRRESLRVLTSGADSSTPKVRSAKNWGEPRALTYDGQISECL
ncbi:hypothetical protein [Xanthomonas melonis]|uniref:hypothetical protein n=1 Tax=Xanthomonas melonis TaxID=56456 RepID=UPI0011B07938|nr:hypothetical protein [Xanthomonas melonis]MCC4601938.1 hypothetical protein [Xanthomonas melonis]